MKLLWESIQAQIELGEAEIFGEPEWVQQLSPSRAPSSHTAPFSSPSRPKSAAPQVAPEPSIQVVGTPGVESPQQSVLQNIQVQSTSAGGTTFGPVQDLASFHEALLHHPFYRIDAQHPHRVALGKGPVQPDFMIVAYQVSEAEQDSNQFLPGEEAELLRKILESVKVSRSLCYTTWLVKRPLQGNLMPRQLTLLRQMLAEEVRQIQPRKILLLGEKVLQTVIGRQYTLQEHGGIPYSFQNTPCAALIEPVHMLEHPSLKRVTWKQHLPRTGFFEQSF